MEWNFDISQMSWKQREQALEHITWEIRHYFTQEDFEKATNSYVCIAREHILARLYAISGRPRSEQVWNSYPEQFAVEIERVISRKLIKSHLPEIQELLDISHSVFEHWDAENGMKKGIFRYISHSR